MNTQQSFNTADTKELEAITTLTHELFGESPLSVERLPLGNINFVYDVNTNKEGSLIFQLNPNKLRLKLFNRGNEAMAEARKHGVPAPVVIASGDTLVPYAYEIYRKIEGVTAYEFEGPKENIWKELGVYAKRINLIPVSGFGRVGYWKDKQQMYYDSWRDYVENELELFVHSEWLGPEIFSDDARKRFEARIDEMKGWNFNPTLIHGDLALKNTIIDESGKIVGIIDWDDTIHGSAPEQELAQGFLWMSPEEQRSFIAGYGINEDERETLRRNVETFQLLLKLELAIWNVRDKDELETAKLICKEIGGALQKSQ